MPLLFGVEPFVMDPELETLPTSQPLNDVVVWGSSIFYATRDEPVLVIAPYDQRLLDEFDGGAIHFCGASNHFIPALTAARAGCRWSWRTPSRYRLMQAGRWRCRWIAGRTMPCWLIYNGGMLSKNKNVLSGA